MAISDGLVSVMETKYFYTFWRPETAIHAGDIDANPKTDPDLAFTPFVPAPCFPSYGSAHAAASYAARRIAEIFFGDDCQTIVLSSLAVPGDRAGLRQLRGNHRRHRRCASVWRHSFPVRPARRRPSGKADRAVGLHAQHRTGYACCSDALITRIAGSRDADRADRRLTGRGSQVHGTRIARIAKRSAHPRDRALRVLPNQRSA
jgi:hypothetical protein